MHRLHEVLRMCSDSEKNMSAFADQNHAPSLTCVRLEFSSAFQTELNVPQVCAIILIYICACTKCFIAVLHARHPGAIM